ncbi:hypothetical protein FGB62_96g113 [Gracilaria domingensis]|nr:hypothetical protein FGB62_96g113 [Gracilaria domingensis]
MVSVKSDFVQSALARGSKLRYSSNREYVLVKPLHTFLVLRLETGTKRSNCVQPYISAEHVSIERTAREMVKFLETYFRRLEYYLGVRAYPSYFVSDEDKAFTAAAVWVFNRMYVSEYAAVMLLSSQRDDASIRYESVRTILVHCTVHKSRNIRKFVEELARERHEKKDSEMYSSLNRFLQQLFSFLRSADSYSELCYRAGVDTRVLSVERFPFVRPEEEGRLENVITSEQCFRTGEAELWTGLSPTSRSPALSKPVHKVRLESRIGKEQLRTDIEVGLRKEVGAEDDARNDTHDAVHCSLPNEMLHNGANPQELKGVCKLLYGRFNAFVKYDSLVSVDGVDRALIHFYCPFLSHHQLNKNGVVSKGRGLNPLDSS